MTSDTNLSSGSGSGSGSKDKKHFCPEIDCPRNTRSFGSNADLQRHINMHKGYKPFPCEYPGCGKAYGQRNKLVKHGMREHRGWVEPRAGDGKREGQGVQEGGGGKRARSSLSRVAVLRSDG